MIPCSIKVGETHINIYKAKIKLVFFERTVKIMKKINLQPSIFYHVLKLFSIM